MKGWWSKNWCKFLHSSWSCKNRAQKSSKLWPRVLGSILTIDFEMKSRVFGEVWPYDTLKMKGFQSNSNQLGLKNGFSTFFDPFWADFRVLKIGLQWKSPCWADFQPTNLGYFPVSYRRDGEFRACFWPVFDLHF